MSNEFADPCLPLLGDIFFFGQYNTSSGCCRIFSFFRHVATTGSSISVSQRYSLRGRSSELFIGPRTNANRSKPDGITSISRITEDSSHVGTDTEIISMGKKIRYTIQCRMCDAPSVICQVNTSIFVLSFRAFARAYAYTPVSDINRN